MKKIFLVLSALLIVSCQSPPPPPPVKVEVIPVKPLYDDAKKLNKLSPKMSKDEVLTILGEPASSSYNDTIDIYCNNYKLYDYTTDFKGTVNTYYVVFDKNGLVEYNSGDCYNVIDKRKYQYLQDKKNEEDNNLKRQINDLNKKLEMLQIKYLSLRQRACEQSKFRICD